MTYKKPKKTQTVDSTAEEMHFPSDGKPAISAEAIFCSVTGNAVTKDTSMELTFQDAPSKFIAADIVAVIATADVTLKFLAENNDLFNTIMMYRKQFEAKVSGESAAIELLASRAKELGMEEDFQKIMDSFKKV